MSTGVPETTINPHVPEPEEKLRSSIAFFCCASSTCRCRQLEAGGAEPQLSWITPEPQVQPLGGVRAENGPI